MLLYTSILRLLRLTFFKLRWYLSLDSRFIRTFRSSLTKISWAIINNLYQRFFVYYFQPGHRQYVFLLSMVVSVVEGFVGKKFVYKATGTVRCLCFTDFSKLRANVCNNIFSWSCNRKSNSVRSFCPYRTIFFRIWSMNSHSHRNTENPRWNTYQSTNISWYGFTRWCLF